MPRPLAIACLQTAPEPDFEAALEQALALAAVAVEDGAQLLLLPEYCGGLVTRGRAFTPPFAEEAEHPVLLGLRQFARDNAVCIVVGSVAIPSSNGRILNRQFVIDATGAIVARYDKLHLFDIELAENRSYRESDQVEPGSKVITVDVLGTRLGLSICYDLRFPGLYRQMAQAGAEVLLVPAAFTRTTGEAHWHVLNRARAIENGAFVIAPCAVGDVAGGGASYGHSLIISPWGEVLADGGDSPGVISHVIDLDEVATTRRRIPSVAHDRSFQHIHEAGQAVA